MNIEELADRLTARRVRFSPADNLRRVAINHGVCPNCGGNLEPPRLPYGTGTRKVRTCYECDDSFYASEDD